MADDAKSGWFFEMTRSIWLPTNRVMYLTTAVSGTAAAFCTRAVCHELHVVGTVATLFLPWVFEFSILLFLRSIEELCLDMSSDVCDDRANGTLWLFGIPSVGLCVAWLCVLWPLSVLIPTW